MTTFAAFVRLSNPLSCASLAFLRRATRASSHTTRSSETQLPTMPAWRKMLKAVTVSSRLSSRRSQTLRYTAVRNATRASKALMTAAPTKDRSITARCWPARLQTVVPGIQKRVIWRTMSFGIFARSCALMQGARGALVKPRN